MVVFVAGLLAAGWASTALLGFGLFKAAARGDRELIAAGLGTSPPASAAMPRQPTQRLSRRVA
jgi:hypothetical protein